MHIKQKTQGIYTIVDLENYNGDINNHPSVTNFPELFEVVTNDDIPSKFQILTFAG